MFESDRGREMDYYRLGLGTIASNVCSWRFDRWGSRVTVGCVHDPQGARTPFELRFFGCSRVGLERLTDEDEVVGEIGLLGITLGEGDGRSPAFLFTSLFELSVTYTEFSVARL